MAGFSVYATAIPYWTKMVFCVIIPVWKYMSRGQFGKNKCPDCQKPIWDKSVRCRACAFVLLRGRPISEETKEKIRRSTPRDAKHYLWKGERAGYHAMHSWAKRRLKRPSICPDCGQRPPYDLANISQKYKRDLLDWVWLCRSCHTKFDIKNGTRPNPPRMFGRKWSSAMRDFFSEKKKILVEETQAKKIICMS